MPSRKLEGTALILSQRAKVLLKLYEFGCKTEKDLQSLTMERALLIPNISIQDLTIIMELQKQTKANKLFSYLGGGGTDEPAKQSD